MLAPSLVAALALATMPVDPHSGESPLTAFRVSVVADGLNLSWHDAEDLLKGFVLPGALRVGEAFTVTVDVGSYAGPPFEGPVTLSLRPLAELGGTDSQTVARGEGARLWAATFTPRVEGPHRLEVSFLSTRHKVVRGELSVAPARLPRWLLGAVGGSLIVVAVAFGAWLVLRRQGATP